MYFKFLKVFPRPSEQSAKLTLKPLEGLQLGVHVLNLGESVVWQPVNTEK